MIEVNNLTDISVDKDFLKKISQIILKGEKKKNKDLSIALIGQSRIKELNKKYRKKNKTTDVLAFSAQETQNLSDETLSHLHHISLIFPSACVGEVIISLEEVKKNTKKFQTTFKKELIKTLIHGILHLLGYDHEKGEQKAKEMEDKQNYYFLESLKKCEI